MQIDNHPVKLAGMGMLLWAASSCATLVQPEVPDVTSDFAPPGRWRSGVEFRMGDPVVHAPNVKHVTRIEFTSSAGRRVVTNADLFRAPNGELRTPWYRLTPSEDPLVIRVTVEHPGGAQTTGEYLLSVKKEYFYMVGANVYTRSLTLGSPAGEDANLIGFPLNPAASASPGDSLWITYRRSPRICFEGAVCD
jgi:hypothetical protein